jgi:dihydropteroate synthase
MHDFLMKEIQHTDIEQELVSIGFDKSYTHKAKEKFEYKNFKIFDLSPAQANIIKQVALTVGADCGTHREVITGKIEKSACVLGGSIAQLKKIGQKLQFQPFGLKVLGQKIIEEIEEQIELTTTTKLMGILNVTPDSFSDGGMYFSSEKALEHFNNLVKAGADIIDIGAESTKPYSTPVSSEEQLKRLVPILENLPNKKPEISIDTRSSQVALRCIELGANIINDVSGFDFDPKMVEVIAKYPNVKVIIQHSKGTPENMQDNPQYKNLMDEIYKNLNSKINFAISKGVKKENIIIDPGIGFGKTKEQNFEILRRWQELRALGCPVLIGVSRKSLLNIPNATNEEKDIATFALNSVLIRDKVDIIRVHNVELYKNSNILNF